MKEKENRRSIDEDDDDDDASSSMTTLQVISLAHGVSRAVVIG